LERKVLDSWGISVTDETPQELATRRLDERPPESKRLERKSTLLPRFLIEKVIKGLERVLSGPFVYNLKPLLKLERFS
jgi:hypothetical protein